MPARWRRCGATSMIVTACSRRRARRRCWSRPAGTRLDTNITRTFAVLVRTVGITTPAGQRPPRLADFRHSFCTATLLDWYRDGEDVHARMPGLSTFLGHADPKSTYWYLTGTPQLLALAAARLEHVFGAGDA